MADGGALVKRYDAEPTPALFHADDSFVKYLAGPLGSGKSSACIVELLFRAMNQQPDEWGVRRTRWAVVRNHYPELKSTTIKTYQEWIPASIAPVVYSTPIVSRLRQKMEDGTTLDMEVLFLALDQPDDVKKLLSIEFTGVYLNEAREAAWEIIEALISRVPRYPQTIKDADGKTTYGPTYPGIVMDSNPPRNTHWLYEKFETGNIPKGWKKFQQPPAVFYDEETETFRLNPDAENLSHLDDLYYQRQIDAAGTKQDFIRVNLAGEFGMSRLGKPVFPKFSEYKHVSKAPIIPSRSSQLILAFDFGLHQAMVAGQLGYGGIRLLEELYDADASLEDFLDDSVLPLLAMRFPGYNVVAVGDPAGVGRSGLDKRTPFMVLKSRGIKAFPASTNQFIPRKEAVDFFLGKQDGLLLDPKLTMLREGFGGGYVFGEKKDGKGIVSEKPVKNEYSHPMDAVQYFALFARFGARNLSKPTPKDPPKPTLWA